ncbi:MAG TPA: hypothetical protein VFU15_08135, partial [Bacteroidia bacterium]|nr:hypothetical protein [Bacteroidia bacterium]
MRLALLLFFLLPASVVSAQKPDSCDCKSINSYAENHLGPGQYAKDYSKTPYTGICGQLGYQGVPYLWHKYENGYLVKRIDYDYSSRTVTYFDDIRKDTLISVQKTFTMDTKILVDEDIIYESGGNRYERDTKFWTNGDSLEVTRYRYLKRGEPGATDDWRLAFNRDDYYWEPVKDGPYISFHEWGSAPTKFRHVVGNYTNGQRSGYWEVRFSNGNLKSQGNFVNDRENGHWKYFQYY